MRFHVLPKSLLVAAAFTATFVVSAAAQTQDSLRAVAASQLSVRELSEGRPETSYADLEALEVELGTTLPIRLFRFNPRGSTHDPGVLVARIRGEVVELGRSSSPAASRAVRLLEPVLDTLAARKMARLLAVCLDPNGARKVEFPFDQTQLQDSAITAFVVEPGWARTRDSVWHPPGGGLLVRVTILSTSLVLGKEVAQPVIYVFDFSADGQLAAWHQNAVSRWF